MGEEKQEPSALDKWIEEKQVAEKDSRVQAEREEKLKAYHDKARSILLEVVHSIGLPLEVLLDSHLNQYGYVPMVMLSGWGETTAEILCFAEEMYTREPLYRLAVFLPEKRLYFLGRRSEYYQAKRVANYIAGLPAEEGDYSVEWEDYNCRPEHLLLNPNTDTEWFSEGEPDWYKAAKGVKKDTPNGVSFAEAKATTFHPIAVDRAIADTTYGGRNPCEEAEVVELA